MDFNLPVVNGVVCAGNLEQAIERCGTKAGNKGWSAAQAAARMTCRPATSCPPPERAPGAGFFVLSIHIMLHRRIVLAAAVLACCACGAAAEEIGSVDTAFKWVGPNHKIVVEAFDDPKVEGVACYVSKPERGGMAGMVGVAEEVSDVSIACRQVGPIRFKEALPRQEDAFTERRSLVFKTLHVVRMVDAARNTLVYLTYSDKLITGSPKNAVTAVAVPRTTVIPVKK